jgi:hypothetical protein
MRSETLIASHSSKPFKPPIHQRETSPHEKPLTREESTRGVTVRWILEMTAQSMHRSGLTHSLHRQDQRLADQESKTQISRNSLIAAFSFSAAGAVIGTRGRRSSLAHLPMKARACLMQMGLVSMNRVRIRGSMW